MMARFIKAEIVEALIESLETYPLSTQQTRMINRAQAALEKPDFGPVPPDGLLMLICLEWEGRRGQGVTFPDVAKPILMAYYIGADIA
jgi:hypothetical protein